MSQQKAPDRGFLFFWFIHKEKFSSYKEQNHDVHSLCLPQTRASGKDKIIKILDVLFEGNESDFIAGIRNKASE